MTNAYDPVSSVEPQPVLLAVLGSTAYGLATKDSDQDLAGVYVAPTRDVLGLRGHDVTTATATTVSPDITLHELAKAVRLGLNGNPTIIELLFADTYKVCEPIGSGLVGLRESLLAGPRVRSAFLGSAESQMKRLINRAARGEGDGPRSAKHARHIIRLLREGTTLLRTGEVRLSVGDQREEIFALGELARRDLETFSLKYEAEVTRLLDVTSVLPEQANETLVESFIVETRLSLLR
jgi:uncharacterized protein